MFPRAFFVRERILIDLRKEADLERNITPRGD